MKTHYGQFLKFADRITKRNSEDIGLLILRKKTIEKQLYNLNEEINYLERKFLEEIKIDWDFEEIEDAKEKFKNL